ncbi:MAG TPA: hypothetical protein VMY42_15815, partial [Thermoguttaceae bacterium]|nr:hypothetical protein [Thermoguttaceae bacterium]
HFGGVGVENLYENSAGPSQFQGNRQIIRADLHAQAARHTTLFTNAADRGPDFLRAAHSGKGDQCNA